MKYLKLYNNCYYIFGIFVYIMILFSCAPENDNDSDQIYQTKTFNATGINGYYTIQAELRAIGEHCKVWVEEGSGVTGNTAQSIVNKYDNEIYSKVIPVFGNTQITINTAAGNETKTTMEFTDFFGDSDGKLCILLLDIQDNYISGENNTYTAGYFNPNDFLNSSYSNGMDMIYIDTYPGINYLSTAYGTLAHELQHMINFITSLTVRWWNNTDGVGGNREPYIDNYLMDTWIDEGLSESAEWLYDGHSDDRINWFNNDKKGTIGKGNNFFIWGNYDGESILDEYSTVYLFFQWLRLQANNNPAIYKDILISKKPNYLAVIEAIDKYYNASDKYNNWDTLLKTWLAANSIKSSTGKYGYKNDSKLNSIKTPSIPANSAVISLRPGEGVYSLIKDSVFTPPNDGVNGIGPNIKYAGLSSSFPNDNYSVNNVLLTYNSSTSGITYSGNNIVYPNPENGTTTGSPLPSASFVSGRFASDEVKGPHRIGMQDMLRQSITGRNILMNNFSAVDFSGFNREE